MKIGITFDLKAEEPSGSGLPDDFQEEFDSPATIEAIASVLHGLGHDVIMLGDGRELIQKLLADPPDFVFNFAEGQGIGRCREARVPAVLEMLGIPYTGSDPLTLAATLDKDCAKKLVQGEVPVPPSFLVRPEDDVALVCACQHALVAFPAIVKPAWEGSSKGIHSKCLVDTPAELIAVVQGLRQDYRQPILVEEYVAGDELTVGVLGNDPPQILGIMRVLPHQPGDRFVYSLEVKRDYLRQVRYEAPPLIPERDLEAVRRATLAAHRLLGCRDVARIDFRLRHGVPYFLEVNPLPGLNPETGDIVILAKMSGWSYEKLVAGVFHAALGRFEKVKG